MLSVHRLTIFPWFLAITQLVSCISPTGGTTLNQSSELLLVDGKPVKIGDLPPKLQMQVYQAEKDRFEKLNAIGRQYLTEVYDNGGQALASQLDEDEKQISDESLRKFYEEKRAFIPYEFEYVKPELRRLYVAEKRKSEAKTHTEGLITAHGVLLQIARPEPPRFLVPEDGYPFVGNLGEGGTRKIVQFVDYSCPHCRDAEPKLQEMLDQDKKLILVAIDSPIHGPMSELYSKGAWCARKFSVYKAFRSKMLNKSVRDQEREFGAMATVLDLDAGIWHGCLSSPEAETYLRKSMAVAKNLGIEATPRFSVDGVIVDSVEELQKQLQIK